MFLDYSLKNGEVNILNLLSFKNIFLKYINIKYLSSKHIFTIIIGIIFFIISYIFIYPEDSTLLGSVLISGITACSLIYNAEQSFTKSKKIEENLKTLIYNKIKKTNNDLNSLRSDLEYHNYCLTYKGNNSKLRFDELIGMWDKYSNSLIEFFGRDDFYLISTFFQNLPELNGYSSHHLITECNTSELWEKKSFD